MADVAASVLARLKNYYDIYYLAQKFDFDGATLTEVMRKTFENRGHQFTAEQFEQVMNFGRDTEMQKKWKAFCRKIDTKTDDFGMVLKKIKAFLAGPYTEAVQVAEYSDCWPAINGKWNKKRRS